MARLRTQIARAAAIHQRAAGAASAAGRILQGYTPIGAVADQLAEQSALASRLVDVSRQLIPSWLGAPLVAPLSIAAVGGLTVPTFVRVGEARPLDGVSFPVVIPLVRAGHIAIDGDARDPRVEALLRSLILRLLATAPAGALRLHIIDGTGVGTIFHGFGDSLFASSASTHNEMCQLLTEAEQWIARGTGGSPAATMLLIIASLPELTSGHDLARISALATSGPTHRLHIIATGWPPPPLTAETTQRPLAHCTQITLRNPYAWVGDPPGTTFTAPGGGPNRLNSPVELDPAPSAELVQFVCDEVRAAAGRRTTAGAQKRQLELESDIQDKTPTQSDLAAWHDYVQAAQRLDAVRKETTALIAKHTSARAAALEDLTAVHNRLAAQGAQLSDLAARAGLPAPPGVGCPEFENPRWDTIGPGGPAPTAAFAAIHTAHALLDEEESVLSNISEDAERSLVRIVVLTCVGAVVVLAVVLGWATQIRL